MQCAAIVALLSRYLFSVCAAPSPNTICFWSAGLRLIRSLALISLEQKSPQIHEMKTTPSDCGLTRGVAAQYAHSSYITCVRANHTLHPTALMYVLALCDTWTLLCRHCLSLSAISLSLCLFSLSLLILSQHSSFPVDLLPNLTSPMSLLDQPL